MRLLNKKNPYLALGAIIVLINLVLIAPNPLRAENIIDRMTDSISGVGLVNAGDPAQADALAQTIIGRIIGAFLSLFGVFFLALLIYGGFRWMNARGNEEEAKKAKDIITRAVIGLVIALSAYAITYFISNALTTATA